LGGKARGVHAFDPKEGVYDKSFNRERKREKR